MNIAILQLLERCSSLMCLIENWNFDWLLCSAKDKLNLDDVISYFTDF